MQRKSFVAISFGQQKLQVVKLNSQKTKVEKFAGVDLPQGLIADYKVVNIEGLATVIKNVWRELKLSEKTVGLVVPEFSTFVKPITLPKIELSELDEAVRWQAQEFLPSGTTGMVMDWMIVSETPDKFNILTLAMKQEILAGYVDSVSLAGLFPLLVKTPAIILTALSGLEPIGKLIVFSNFGETILVVADGQKILGSSVIGIEEKADVPRVASQIIRHYRDIEVKKFYVGGGDISQAFAGELQKSLGRPVEVLKTNIHGLPPDQVQKYLIPVALAQAKSVGPSDEKTINLLPFNWVRKYENRRLSAQIWGLLTISACVVFLCLVLTASIYFYLGRQEASLTQENNARQEGTPKEITERVLEINESATKVLAISEVAKTPQEVINAILKAKPIEVTINHYELDLDTGKLILSGVAGPRESLVKFKEGLEENKDFSPINIPISSFEKEEDFEYKMSFIYIPASKKVGNTPKIPQNSN